MDRKLIQGLLASKKALVEVAAQCRLLASHKEAELLGVNEIGDEVLRLMPLISKAAGSGSTYIRKEQECKILADRVAVQTQAGDKEALERANRKLETMRKDLEKLEVRAMQEAHSAKGSAQDLSSKAQTSLSSYQGQDTTLKRQWEYVSQRLKKVHTSL